jgi:hypothetical protein
MHSGRPPTADYSDKLSNSRGVLLRLSDRQVGLELSLAVSGLTISLK